MTKEEAQHIVDVAFDVPLAVRRSGEDRTYHEDEIREAKNMAIEALEQEPKWIPVSERLPEDRQSVLVWCPQYKNIYCAYLEKEQWWIFGAFVQIVPNEVVAWMPLPEPNQAESEVQNEERNSKARNRSIGLLLTKPYQRLQ